MLVELVVYPQTPTPAPGLLVVQYHVVVGIVHVGTTTEPEFVKHDHPDLISPALFNAVYALEQLAYAVEDVFATVSDVVQYA